MLRLISLIVLAAVSFAVSAETAPLPRGGTRVEKAVSGERRVALVIGNDAYKNVPPLEKAANDGKAMASELKRAGFEVMAYSNIGRRAMNDAINEFKDRIANGGVGVLFFAGHGVQVEGTNFLLPIDIEAARAEDLDSEAINVPNTMEKIAKSKARFALLILDACRDNPFPKKAGRSLGGTRGMAMADAPKGLMVLYSAGANQQALDKLAQDDRDPNGLFTREFVRNMRDPNVRVDELLRKVRQSVAQKAEAVSHEQNPALYEQTTGDFYLYPASMRTQSAASTARHDPGEADIVFWNSVKDSSDPTDIKAYIDQFPKGQFVSLANKRLERIKDGSVSSSRTSNNGRTTDDCWREAAARDIAPEDKGEFINACISGREFKLAKSGAECQREAMRSGIHPTDLVEFINACKYGKPYQIVVRKTANDCVREAQQKGIKGPEMIEYTQKCYGGGATP